MNSKLTKNILLGTIIFLLSGCAYWGGGPEIDTLGPPLLRLTSAVHGVAERPDIYGFPSGGSGEECMRLGVEDDPSLLVPFAGLVVKAKCENKHAILLVCDADGSKVLMEDAGCTTMLDYRAEMPVRPCDFSAQIEEACR